MNRKIESDLQIYSGETDAFLDVFVLCLLRAIKNLIATCLPQLMSVDYNNRVNLVTASQSEITVVMYDIVYPVMGFVIRVSVIYKRSKTN